MIRVLPLVVLLAACNSGSGEPPASCGGGSAPSLTAQDLVKTTGCGDVVVAAGTADGTRLLQMTADSLLADAANAGGTKTWRVDLPDDTLTVVLQGGSALVQGTCNDVMPPDHAVDTSWTPSSGRAVLTLHATPSAGNEPWPYDGTATFSLPRGACFEALGGDAVWVGPISFDAQVGWLPG